MRSEPPPSLPCATGTSPAATAAALPPLDPPGVRVGSQGLRVGGRPAGSVTGIAPSSEVAVLPRMTNPAARRAPTVRSSRGDQKAGSPLLPKRARRNRTRFRSLIAIGTP